jgi:hypothetical protein
MEPRKSAHSEALVSLHAVGHRANTQCIIAALDGLGQLGVRHQRFPAHNPVWLTTGWVVALLARRGWRVYTQRDRDRAPRPVRVGIAVTSRHSGASGASAAA